MQKQVTFLVAEDDDVEFEAVVRFLVKNGYRNPVRRARDGVECYEALKGTDDIPKVEGPCIVLMDINMPRMNGLDCVLNLRADPSLKQHKIVMLTTSSAPKDMIMSYSLEVDGYVVKDEMDRTLLPILRDIMPKDDSEADIVAA